MTVISAKPHTSNDNNKKVGWGIHIYAMYIKMDVTKSDGLDFLMLTFYQAVKLRLLFLYIIFFSQIEKS